MAAGARGGSGAIADGDGARGFGLAAGVGIASARDAVDSGAKAAGGGAFHSCAATSSKSSGSDQPSDSAGAVIGVPRLGVEVGLLGVAGLAVRAGTPPTGVATLRLGGAGAFSIAPIVCVGFAPTAGTPPTGVAVRFALGGAGAFSIAPIVCVGFAPTAGTPPAGVARLGAGAFSIAPIVCVGFAPTAGTPPAGVARLGGVAGAFSIAPIPCVIFALTAGTPPAGVARLGAGGAGSRSIRPIACVLVPTTGVGGDGVARDGGAAGGDVRATPAGGVAVRLGDGEAGFADAVVGVPPAGVAAWLAALGVPRAGVAAWLAALGVPRAGVAAWLAAVGLSIGTPPAGVATRLVVWRCARIGVPPAGVAVVDTAGLVCAASPRFGVSEAPALTIVGPSNGLGSPGFCGPGPPNVIFSRGAAGGVGVGGGGGGALATVRAMVCGLRAGGFGGASALCLTSAASLSSDCWGVC